MKRPHAVVFLGPSLPAAEARALFPEALLWGPARQGDVLRALAERPRAIALVDGVFESQPSVWHQELRVAISEGVHLFGASSMGALRAVELAPFGMIGIGRVFEAFRDGRITDDADVALLHADAEHDFRPLTVPFVNVVATAEAALDARVLGRDEARALVEHAHRIHYKDRRWPDLVKALPPARQAAFDRFRKESPQDVKAADARLCLTAAREACRAPAASRPLPSLSAWARRAWLDEQGAPPDGDGREGLKTLLLAEWCRSHGLVAPPGRVAFFEKRARKLRADPGWTRRWAEALALEELVLAQPGLLVAQAPSIDEGRWIAALA